MLFLSIGGSFLPIPTVNTFMEQNGKIHTISLVDVKASESEQFDYLFIRTMSKIMGFIHVTCSESVLYFAKQYTV